MTRDEETDLIDGWKGGDLRSGAKLVKANEGLIRRVVTRFVTDRVEIEDLMQIGRIYFLWAAERHDAALGRLSTYAWKTIFGHVRNHARIEKYAVHVYDSDHIAGERPHMMHLDQRLSAAGPMTIGDMLVAPEQEDAAPGVDAAKMVAKLRPRERDVLERLFVRGETQEQIGESYGVTKQAIGAVKTKALAKLRKAATRKEWRR